MRKTILLSAVLALGLIGGNYASASSLSSYTVQDNDTFWTISQKLNINLNQLMAANPTVDPTNLYNGLVIKLPSSSSTPASSVNTYTIQAGDNFWIISQKLNINWNSLIAANPNANANNLYVGQIINLPATNTSATPSVTTNNSTVEIAGEVKTDAIIATAKQYLGTPYLYGGGNPTTGFDCSGFTQFVLGKNGISLPHRAADQFNYGTPVSANQLRKGDLVFFKENGSQTITHVGIFLGNDQMISADTAPKNGVQIENVFGNAYYGPCYAGAIRLVN